MKRIAIMGAGSLGTILGAFIAKSGRQVDLIDAYKEHVDALNNDGARVQILGEEKLVVPVTALTPDQMEGVYDVFIYMAKQTYNDVAIPQMKKHSDENTVICTCQNGIPELAVAKYFDSLKVIGVPVLWGATWIAPGISNFPQSEAFLKEFLFTIGSMSGEVTEDVLEVKKILELMGPVEVSTDLMGLRWSKLLMNATFSGMSTVINGTFGDVINDDDAMRCIAYIGRETVRVSKSSGNEMAPYHGEDFTKIFEFSTEKEYEETVANARRIWTRYANTEASMLQDLKKGKKCEIDAINGVVCETGRQFGVSTPINDLVVNIVKMKEKGELEVVDAPLYMFEGLFEL